MYHHCLFCHSGIGRNETVESFQTGRHLAFDQAKGRLWVVCPRCSRWNVSPLEERWEAIEQCERAFRGAVLRKSTENIGLARLADGSDLIRIGSPLLPEFAAWRYTGALARRHRFHQKLMQLTTAGNVANLGYQALVFSKVAAGSPLVLGAGAVLMVTLAGVVGAQFLFHRQVGWGRARIVLPGTSQHLRVRSADARSMRVLSDERSGWKIRLPHTRGVAELTGPDAVFAAGHVLPRVTWSSASPEVVQWSVQRIIAEGGPDQLFASIAKENQGRYGTIANPISLVAAEISAHQSAESEHLTEHLRFLEAQWRDAEAIAKIADDLLVPEKIDASLRELKENRRSSSVSGE